ncbi:MAG: tetratricopeptide repeat protein [Acidobacteria bacterium]|nr:tetratricopeptide repeat protein [Acidobacteriota bacterium]
MFRRRFAFSFISGVFPAGVILLVASSLAAQQAPVQNVTISVRVYDDQTEAHLDRVRLELLRFPDGVLTQVFTDSFGRYTFPPVPPNTYTVRAVRDGFQEGQVDVILKRGDTHAEVAIGLTPIRRKGSQPAPDAISARTLALSPEIREELRKGTEWLYEKKNPARSLPHFQKAVELAPEFYEAHFLMGMAHLQSNAPGPAQEAFEKALQLNQDYLDPHYPLALLCFSSKDFAAGERLLLRAIELDPQGWMGPFELARSYALRSDWAKALQYAEMAHARPAPASKVHILLADVYSAIGRRQQAVAELEEFLRMDPKSPLAPRVEKALATLRANPGQ